MPGLIPDEPMRHNYIKKLVRLHESGALPRGLAHVEVRHDVDYGRTDDLAADGDEFETWGLFLVQHIDKIATELYVGYRNHELDRPGVSIDDIDVGVAGARIKF